MGGGLLEVLAPVRQDPSVHAGVKGLDATVHHLGVPRVVGDLGDGQSRFDDAGSGAACGQQLEASVDQGLGKRLQAGLVGDGEQGTARHRILLRTRRARRRR